MNLQTTKPRAWQVHAFGGKIWVVVFPDGHSFAFSANFDKAVDTAYRRHLARITGRRDA